MRFGGGTLQDGNGFAAIVSGVDDPEARRDRWLVLTGCLCGLVGLAVALACLIQGWSPWFGAGGALVVATGDVLGTVALVWSRRRWRAWQRGAMEEPAMWP
jgi:hypothetical protein